MGRPGIDDFRRDRIPDSLVFAEQLLQRALQTVNPVLLVNYGSVQDLDGVIQVGQADLEVRNTVVCGHK